MVWYGMVWYGIFGDVPRHDFVHRVHRGTDHKM